jgi:hypothetical protein
MRRLTALALTLLLMGGLAACGDDDTDSSTPASTTADEVDGDTGDEGSGDEGSSDDESAAGSGAAGTVTVDGTTYSMDASQQCDPTDTGVDLLDRSLEAQFWGQSADGRVQLDVYIESFGGVPAQSVSWSGPEGIYGSSVTQLGGTWTGDNDDTYADPPVSVDGTRTTGSLTLWDASTMEESIDIDFDVTFPDELTSCR